MNESVIYIFTCNRPIKLESLIKEVCSLQNKYRVYIIDDSSKRDAIEKNSKISDLYDKTTYLGIKEFKDLYNLNHFNINSQFLGNKSWNLGIARNFALDHATLLKHQKVLFIDDDISRIDDKILEEGFLKLTENRFISCFLKGLEDNSIVGHIAKQVGIIDDGPKMLSGGFLFLKPSSISHRFYNFYNEDWIMQLLEKEKERIILNHTVWHDVDQDVRWTFEKLIFQELGELVVEGLLQNLEALNLNSAFWDDIIKNRIKYIEEIREYSIVNKNQYGHDVCNKLIKWLSQFNGVSLQNYIVQNKNEYYEYKI